MADELPTGWADVVEGAFSIPNLADIASLDPVTKNGDGASMDPVIKEGASVWDLLAEDVASLDPVTKNADVASLDPSGSKVRFSVRVRLLHLSNHLNRGELEVDLGEVDLGEQKL